MLKLFVLVTFILTAAIPTMTQAREVSVEPLGVGQLMGACNNAGGDFDAIGSVYYCTVENCDGKGGQCTIVCDNEGGLVTCTGSTPRRHVRVMESFAKLLQSRPVVSLTPGDSGESHDDGSHDSDGPSRGGGRGVDLGNTHSTDNAGMDAGGSGPVFY